jgi:hypothetical protein
MNDVLSRPSGVYAKSSAVDLAQAHGSGANKQLPEQPAQQLSPPIRASEVLT